MIQSISDKMAFIRTRLSTERTFLSYVRTALTFFMSGLALMHYLSSKHPAYFFIGVIFLVCSALIFIYGLISGISHRRGIEKDNSV